MIMPSTASCSMSSVAHSARRQPLHRQDAALCVVFPVWLPDHWCLVLAVPLDVRYTARTRLSVIELRSVQQLHISDYFMAYMHTWHLPHVLTMQVYMGLIKASDAVRMMKHYFGGVRTAQLALGAGGTKSVPNLETPIHGTRLGMGAELCHLFALTCHVVCCRVCDAC